MTYIGGLTWSPNGQFLAYVTRDVFNYGNPGQAALYAVNADGSHLTRLFPLPKADWVSKGRGRWDIEKEKWNPVLVPPAWSPDSQSIAFLGFEGIGWDGSVMRLYSVRADGTGLRELAVLSPPSCGVPFKGAPGSVSWSPDGSQILFSVCGDLHVVRADGSDLHVVARGTYASWSPDGSRIAILGVLVYGRLPPGYDDSGCVLCAVAPDGSNVRVLVRRGDDGGLEAVGPEQKLAADVASCSAGVVVPNPEVSNGLVRDCEALVEMIDRLAVVGLNWDAKAHIAEWEGVTLDTPDLWGDGSDAGKPLPPPRIRSLSLPERGLSGFVPLRTADLTGLWSLDMSGNSLTGPIPSELGRLTELRELDLSHNPLSGPIPPALGKLTELRELNLDGRNSLIGPIPPELVGLTGLQQLHLSFAGRGGAVPQGLGRLVSLRELTLKGMSGPIPRELGNLSGLQQLDLSSGTLDGSIPPELGNLSSLAFLDLSYNELSGAIPLELGNLPSLELLDIRGNHINGCIPPKLYGKVVGYRGPRSGPVYCSQ